MKYEFKLDMTPLIREFGAIAGRVETTLEAAVYQEASVIMQESLDLVPRRDGILAGTGHVDPVKSSGGQVSVEFGYGGPAAPYAWAIHENPRAGKTGGVSPQGKPYKKYAKVGQWKYLELPVMAAQGKITGRIADRMRRILG